MFDFSSEIDNSLDLLFKLEKQPFKKKALLDKGRIVYLQIGLFKSPFVRSPKRKFLKLCHSLYGDDPEICLFVPNRKAEVEYKRTTDERIDLCVDYYTELLEKHNIKGITTVMPLKQLKSEYGTYELKRKLVHRFDLFLCKNSLLYNPRFLTGLGKTFKVANKEPLGVSFPDKESEYDPNFEKNIKRAIFASSFYIKPFSDNYSVPFGTLTHTKPELKENLKAVLDQIFSENMIPGGFNNIRAIYIWPSQSKTIPLYICTELPDKFPAVFVKRKKKGLKAVQGEISTQPGKKVTVMPNGEVFVTNDNENKFEEEDDAEDKDSFNDESDEEEGEEENYNRKPKPDLKGKVKGSEDESESEDDEEIEEMEKRLLIKKREANNYVYNTPKKVKNEDGKGLELIVKAKNKSKENGNTKFVSTKKNKKEVDGMKKNKGEGKVKSKINDKKMGKASKKLKTKQEKFNLNEKSKSKNKSKKIVKT